jgi:hypothetical protein
MCNSSQLNTESQRRGYLSSDTSKIPSDLGVSAAQIRDFAQSFVASACFRGHLTKINLLGGDQLTLSCSPHQWQVQASPLLATG